MAVGPFQPAEVTALAEPDAVTKKLMALCCACTGALAPKARSVTDANTDKRAALVILILRIFYSSSSSVHERFTSRTAASADPRSLAFSYQAFAIAVSATVGWITAATV
jgi:hypothetical protein